MKSTKQSATPVATHVGQQYGRTDPNPNLLPFGDRLDIGFPYMRKNRLCCAHVVLLSPVLPAWCAVLCALMCARVCVCVCVCVCLCVCARVCVSEWMYKTRHWCQFELAQSIRPDTPKLDRVRGRQLLTKLLTNFGTSRTSCTKCHQINIVLAVFSPRSWLAHTLEIEGHMTLCIG